VIGHDFPLALPIPMPPSFPPRLACFVGENDVVALRIPIPRSGQEHPHESTDSVSNYREIFIVSDRSVSRIIQVDVSNGTVLAITIH